MQKVKKMVEAGVRVGTAIRECLPVNLSEFAARHGLPRSSTNEAINGVRPATPAQIEALIAELGGTHEEWSELLRAARIAHAHAA